MSNISKYNYRWVPSLHSALVIPHYVNSGKPREKAVDRRAECSPIENQGDLGSCTTFGILGCMEFLELKEHKTFVELSHLFLYRAEHALEGDIGQDNGANIADGIKCVATLGVCAEQLWPYVDSNFDVNPPPICYKDAVKRRVTAAKYIVSDEDAKDLINNGFIFTCGITVYESFEGEAAAATGIIPVPQSNEQILGGHCIDIVGYDDNAQHWIGRNSWGTDWGMSGYFYLPYCEAYTLQDKYAIIKMLGDK